MAGRVFVLSLLGRICSFLPESRFFRLKAAVYRIGGRLDISADAMIFSSVRFCTYPVSIGSRTHIGHRTLFIGGAGCPISIGKDCDIAPEVAFITGTHEIGDTRRRAGREAAYPIIVGDGTWIGARAVILGGVEIGPGCIVAAGSVVKDSMPANTLIAGIPAVIKKSLPV